MTAVSIGDLREALAAHQLSGAAELAAALEQACGGPAAAPRLVSLQRLKKNVYRAAIEAGDATRSLVLKRSNPVLARRNILVARRWLPVLGMEDVCAKVLGSAAQRDGDRMWVLYEDLGDCSVHATRPDRRRVEVAAEGLARLHAGSAGHAILSECRYHAGDLGAGFVTANILDAIRGLELLEPRRIPLSPEQLDARDRLLARLRTLRDQLPERLRLLAEHGGPDALLHGDLWHTNVFVVDAPPPEGLRSRLVDWDHAGVGPASYDLSTWLFRFPPEERSWVLDRYRAAVAPAGWSVPGARELNMVFETLECARYANRALWPPVMLLVDRNEWGYYELTEVASWFDALRPALPE